MASTKTNQLKHIESICKQCISKYRHQLLPVGLIISGLLLIGLFFLFKDVPTPSKLTKTPAPVSTKILDRNGQLLYEVYSDQNRTPIKLDNLPDYVHQATIAIEDKNFYKHHGLDTAGIIRAAFKTLSGQRLEGGSTLTQQLVKIALLSDSSRTITRKIREAFLAIATELTYSKDQILELYLNHAPYGGTTYGIETASKIYFNKSAKELNLAEAALLAGLPQSPTRLSPFGAHPELAISRQHQVLKRMVEDGYIKQDQADAAKSEKLNFASEKITINAPHFALMVRDQLVNKYGEERVNLGGLRVTTTLDLDLQNYFQASLSSQMEKLTKLKIGNGAALVTKPNTGEIISMIGSKNYFDKDNDGQVNITTSLRQPGSSIKPLNYAVGLLGGWTASLTYLDIPTCFNVAGQKGYCPKNYDNTFHGPVDMRRSLANSFNIPAVKQLALNGLENFIATASAMGISSWKNPDNYGLSLTLGGGEVTMIDMAKAFGTFANSGVTVPLVSIIKVETYTGEILEEYKPSDTADLVQTLKKNWPTFWETIDETKDDPIRATLPEEIAYIISNILADNNARSTAFGTSSQLVIPGKTVSVKTGTTNDMRDNWTIGYTPDFLAITWVGNNDNTPMSYVASGVTGASPIWNTIMKKLLKGIPDHPLPTPNGVKSHQVCNQTGLLAIIENQCESHSELFIEGILPPAQNNQKQQIWVRRDNKTPITDPADQTVDRDLEEHVVISDPFTKNFCLDCNYPKDEKNNVIYPQFTIDISNFNFNRPLPTNFLPTPTP